MIAITSLLAISEFGSKNKSVFNTIVCDLSKTFADEECSGSASNSTPIINTTSLDEGEVTLEYSFLLNGSDPDGDNLSWSVLGTLPEWISLDGSTGEISGTPTEKVSLVSFK